MSENKHIDLAKGTPLSEYRPLPRPDLSDSEWISGKSLPRPEPEKVSDSMIEDVYISQSIAPRIEEGWIEESYSVEPIEWREWVSAPKEDDNERE